MKEYPTICYPEETQFRLVTHTSWKWHNGKRYSMKILNEREGGYIRQNKL